jgi:hypothetical protein
MLSSWSALSRHPSVIESRHPGAQGQVPVNTGNDHVATPGSLFGRQTAGLHRNNITIKQRIELVEGLAGGTAGADQRQIALRKLRLDG